MNSTLTYAIDMTPELHAVLQDVVAALARALADGGGDRADHAALARAQELLAEVVGIG